MRNNRLNILIILMVLTVLVFFPLSDLKAKTVEDMMGREVELPEKVERVATAYTPATQFVLALGAEDKLVAAAHGKPNQQVFAKLAPGVDELPEVAEGKTGLNLESVNAVNPDLVIMSPYGGAEKAASRLEKMGITALIIKPEGFSRIRETIQLLGKAMGVEEQAELVDHQYEKIAELTKRTRDIPENEKKTVYFANSDLLDTVGSGMLQTDLIEMAGAINPASQAKAGFAKISPEQLIMWDPDRIIVSQFYRGEISELIDSSKYQGITAVREENVVRIPSNLEPWDYPSPSSGLITIWLGMKLYPERFQDLELIDVVDEFYQTLYGETFSELNGELQ